MERQSTQPMTVEEAKARLRAAATQGDILAWVSHSPQQSVLIAFILGLTAGTSSAARRALTSGVLSLLTRSRPSRKSSARGAPRG
jgi:hypothetical protein